MKRPPPRGGGLRGRQCALLCLLTLGAAALLWFAWLVSSPPTRLTSCHAAGCFTCLEDTPAVWDQRRARGRAFVDSVCDPTTKLGKFFQEPRLDATVPIPVVFMLHASSSSVGVLSGDDGNNSTTTVHNSGELRLLANALNIAAHFNDRVILLYLFNDGHHPYSHATSLNISLHERVDVHLVDLSLPGAIADAYHHQGDTNATTNNNNTTTASSSPRLQRWFALYQFAREWNLANMFVMASSDVLVLRNVTKEMVQCYNGCRTVGASLSSLFIAQQELGDFARFATTHIEHGDDDDERVFELWIHEYLSVWKEENDCYRAWTIRSRPQLMPQQALDGLLHFQKPFVQDDAGLPYIPNDEDDFHLDTLAFSLSFAQQSRREALKQCPLIKVT